MVYGEQISRYVDHFAQNTVARHVHAVVIARGKIGSDKAAVTEQIRHLVVAGQQRFQTVVVAFGLQNFIVFNSAELADDAIGGHHQNVRVSI